jgi:hypothetical protein
MRHAAIPRLPISEITFFTPEKSLENLCEKLCRAKAMEASRIKKSLSILELAQSPPHNHPTPKKEITMTHSNQALIKKRTIKTMVNEIQFAAWKRFAKTLELEPQEWLRNLVMEIVLAANAAEDAKLNGSNVHQFPARRASDRVIKYALAN